MPDTPLAAHPIVPIVTAEGGPYEIGLQHGQQATSQITSNIKTYEAFFWETAKITWAEARERARVFLPTLERSYPEIVVEMRGIAAGAGLTLEDILALNTRSEIALTNYTDKPSEAVTTAASPPHITDGCTGLAQRSTGPGSKLILAQNWDWLEELQAGMVLMHITTLDRTTIRFLNEAGLVGKIGMNSHGFGMCNNALRVGLLDTDRLPTHVMSRRLLQYARSVDEAVGLLEQYGGACASNYILGDTTGAFVDVEVTPHGILTIKPQAATDDQLPQRSPSGGLGTGPGFVAHTNHIINPATAFPRGAAHDHPAGNSFDRLKRIEELTAADLRNTGAPLTREQVRARLTDQQGTPYSICRDRPAGAKGMERMTTLATIMMEFDLDNGTAQGEVTIGRPCDPGLQRVEWPLVS